MFSRLRELNNEFKNIKEQKKKKKNEKYNNKSVNIFHFQYYFANSYQVNISIFVKKKQE